MELLFYILFTMSFFFRRLIAAHLKPAKPFLNGKVNNTNDLYYEWGSDVANPEYYLEVATDSGFTTFAHTRTATTTSHQYFDDPDGNYYARVRVKNLDNGKTSDWSDTVLLVIDTAVAAPAAAPTLSGAVKGFMDLSYSWTSLADANDYQLQVSLSSTFATIDETGTFTTLSVLYNDKDAGTYYARVRGHNTGGYGPWSATVTLTITDLTLTGSVSTDDLVYDWNSMSPKNDYLLQVDTDSTFATPDEYFPTTSALTVSNVPEGTYYARVMARHTDGNSRWSNTVSLAYSAAINPPNLTVSEDINKDALCEWTHDYTGITTFTIEQGEDSGFTVSTKYTGGDSPRAVTQPAGTTRWYRVRGESTGYPWSNVVSLSIAATVAPVYDAASHDSAIMSATENSLSFYLEPVPNATDYRIKLFDYEAGTSHIMQGSLVKPATTSSDRITFKNRPDSTRYECLFEAYNSVGSTGWVAFERNVIKSSNENWANTEQTLLSTPSMVYNGIVGSYPQVTVDFGNPSTKEGATWSVHIYSDSARTNSLFGWQIGATHVTHPVPHNLDLNFTPQSGVRYYITYGQYYGLYTDPGGNQWSVYKGTQFDVILVP